MKHKDLRKINSLIIFGFAVLASLYFAASFLIPLVFAAFLAALIAPFSNLIEKVGINKGIAAFISTLTVLLVIGGLSYVLFIQLRVFAEDVPRMQEELGEFLSTLQQQISESTGISPQEQNKMWQERSETIREELENYLANLLENFLSTLLNLLLVMVYLFLFLLYRYKFFNFVMRYVPSNKEERMTTIINQSSKVVHHYLWGRIKIMCILAAMYIITFLIFDIRHAVLLTIFGALVTIIPYIGPFVSGILPVLFLMIFGGSMTEVLLFAAIILIIQLIESYVLEPLILGTEVSLSPLVIIFAIIIGGMVWGISGMILFVPLFAIIKIISDHTPNLQPIGFLIGNKE